MTRGFLILMLALGGTLSAQHKPITLEAYQQWRSRARPVAGEPVWSPSGAAFAYRDGDDLVLYDVAAHAKRVLARLSEMNASIEAPPADQGDLWQNRNAFTRPLSWSPRGDQILYVSSGDLILVDASSGKWRNLTKSATVEADPKFSPDGTHIAFRRAWDLYTIDLASGKETRITANGSSTLRNGAVDWVYPEELDLATAFWWSPDSRAILYLQFNISGEPLYPHAALLSAKAVAEPQRYPQAGDPNASVRPGVVSASGGPTRWLDVGDTVHSYLIARAGWTPDSRHVWVARLNRVQNELAMLLFDPSTGASKAVYRESDPYWINIEGDPIFLPDSSTYLWTMEGEYRHLYSHPLGTAKPHLITDGFWSVTSVSCVDAKEKQIYYVSTEASPLERQLYRIGFDGMGKTRLTTEPGTHRISMAPGCGSYLDTHSSLTSPPETVLRSTSGASETVFRPANRAVLNEFDLQIPETISFDAPELSGEETAGRAKKPKVKLYGHLIKPPDFDPTQKYPLIVDVYGGPHDQSVRDTWSGFTFDQVLAARGYLVWQMDNRGTYGRGHAFETPVFHKLGEVELADQRAGIEYLIAQGFVDPSRIGVHGWSYGGFMALNMLLNAPDLIHAAFAGAPVTDWRNYDTIYTERYMGLPSENADGYRETALVPRAANLQGRLMIAHNLEDDNVLFQNTAQLTNALQAAGKLFEMQIYEGRGHGVTGASSRQMDAAMLDFFDRALARHPQ